MPPKSFDTVNKRLVKMVLCSVSGLLKVHWLHSLHSSESSYIMISFFFIHHHTFLFFHWQVISPLMFLSVYISESLWYNKFDLKSSYSSFFYFILIVVTLLKLKVPLSHLHNHRKLCGHMSFFPQNNFGFYVYNLIWYMCWIVVMYFKRGRHYLHKIRSLNFTINLQTQ